MSIDLAAPVAFIAGVAQAARRGILVKGGRPLSAGARIPCCSTKTGTTVGGARLLSIEVAPGENADEMMLALRWSRHRITLSPAPLLRPAPSLLTLKVPVVRESMGSGAWQIDGRRVAAGSREMIFPGGHVSEWASRAIRRASAFGAHRLCRC